LQAIDLIKIIKYVKVIDIIYHDMVRRKLSIIIDVPDYIYSLSFNLHDVHDDVVCEFIIEMNQIRPDGIEVMPECDDWTFDVGRIEEPYRRHGHINSRRTQQLQVTRLSTCTTPVW